MSGLAVLPSGVDTSLRCAYSDCAGRARRWRHGLAMLTQALDVNLDRFVNQPFDVVATPTDDSQAR